MTTTFSTLSLLHRPNLGNGGGDNQRPQGDDDAAVGIKTKPRTKRPSLYKVLLLNDDYTPMEFVVYILERYFNLRSESAVNIMMTVHNKGVAVVGVYPFEIAETKVTQVMDCARSNQHPLQCTMEKE
jgi:ATP-dependent Clp protease adaptor protein ClpS